MCLNVIVIDTNKGNLIFTNNIYNYINSKGIYISNDAKKSLIEKLELLVINEISKIHLEEIRLLANLSQRFINKSRLRKIIAEINPDQLRKMIIIHTLLTQNVRCQLDLLVNTLPRIKKGDNRNDFKLKTISNKLISYSEFPYIKEFSITKLKQEILSC